MSIDAVFAVKTGSRFYLMMASLLVVLNVMAFGPAFFFKLLFYSSEIPLQSVIHWSLFFSWYLLFLLKSIIAGSGGLRVRQLQVYILGGLALAILVSAWSMNLNFAQNFDIAAKTGGVMVRSVGVWVNFHLMASFAIFISISLHFRKHLERHMCLIFLASACMMTTALSRMGGLAIIPINSGLFTFLMMLALLSAPIIYDWFKQGKVHHGLLMAVIFYFISFVLFSAIIPLTEFGKRISTALVSF